MPAAMLPDASCHQEVALGTAFGHFLEVQRDESAV
jgi:hypothetical protein